MTSHYHKSILTLVVTALFLTGPVAGQSRELIDKMIDTSRSFYRNEQRFNYILSYSLRILQESEKIGYERGIVNGLWCIADILSKCGDYQKSNQYLAKLDKHAWYLKKNPEDQFYLDMLQGENFFALGLSSYSKQCFETAGRQLLRINDKKSRINATLFYHLSCEIATEQKDSLLAHYRAVLEIIDNPQNQLYFKNNPEHNSQDKALALISMGDLYLRYNAIDSARSLYKKAAEFLGQSGASNYEAYLYDGLGKLSICLNQKEEALQFYKRSIEIAEKYQMTELLIDVYQALHALTRKYGDYKNELNFLHKYVHLKDSLAAIKSQSIELIIDDLVQDQISTIQQKHQERILKGIIALVFPFIYFFLVVVHFIYAANDPLPPTATELPDPLGSTG
ncbi:tetratricopeptide repeat protein [Flavihumibacter sp. CACIAM 22H1]|uniref:tetratricopeptide repeat protein n=1 Tax=Flavihumibacter sp. CACIAM 22H1 TaxID=1812911 RepID=UPI0007A8B172|nr:tetratricopeptide repeat protein [Flavihumibacter sp. CACIAM 22H1]KYP15196.1 MAG: hypothetical protein A1D16_02995 [Flavihumibacter sp. CACIAM 22H1]